MKHLTVKNIVITVVICSLMYISFSWYRKAVVATNNYNECLDVYDYKYQSYNDLMDLYSMCQEDLLVCENK